MAGHGIAHAATEPLVLDRGMLRITDVVSVARGGRTVRIGEMARAAVARSRQVVLSRMSDGRAHYGINTGFGSLARRRIDAGAVGELQRNLIRSHAAGVGDPLPRDVVRGMMLLSAASLARGMSGVRVELIDLLAGMLNAGVTPVVPEIGSVGASGDLAPLAAMGLVMMGEGEAFAPDGRRVRGDEALRTAGLKALTLEAKEGLAIINGTHLMAAQGVLLCHDAARLFDAAMTAGAMSMDACRATDAFLDARVHEARGQPGQCLVAARLRALLDGSEIIPSHREGDPRVQDPYSLRCMPQVLGAAWDCLEYVRGAVERELGAVTDNPLVLGEDIVSAGNFHGMPLAIPLDALAVAIAAVAGIAERRVFWMLSAFDAEAGLKPYLSPSPGLHSGLMIAQYTAAACVNEIVGLAHPASVANIPTSAEVEDYNSFGPRAAAKARRAMDLAETVVAIELICAAEGVECHRPLRSGRGVEEGIARVRRVVPALKADRPLSPDIGAVREMIRSGALEGLGT
jgi:histidine ammonia-lyase